MNHSSLSVVLLILCGGHAALLADEDDLHIAEFSEQSLQKNPQDESAWARLVTARIKDKDLDRAEKALANWKSKVAKPSANLDRLQGEFAFARNDMPAAIEAWLRCLKADPKDWETRAHLADAYGNQRDWSSAIRELSTAIQGNREAGLFAQRAGYRVRAHDWAAAEADIQEANRLDTTHPQVRNLLPRFERSKEWLPTVKKLDASIAKDPGNVSLRLERAEWLVGLGFPDAGMDDVQAAIKANSKSLRAQVWLGVIEWERGNPKNAGDVMKLPFAEFSKEFRTGLRTIDTNADPEVRARFLLTHKQPLLALNEVRDVDGSPAKARALLDLNRLPEAGVAARRAVELHADDSEAWLTLGRLELENGNIQDALEALNGSTKIKRSPEADELRSTATRRLGKK